MDKAEAIKILKDFHDKSALFSIRTALETLHPELKESKDEKTRKEIMEYITLYKDSLDDDEYKSWIAWLEKQGESSIKWNKNTEGNKPQVNHSVLMKTTHGIAEGEWNGEQWHQYRWSDSVKDSDVLSWMELSDLDKQGEQKPVDEAEPKFKVKYAGSEYNVLEVKDIAGVTFYGIEDEPNHIDYVKAENCEIISGYTIKENGSPYPTKPAVFSEQKPTWSEEDEKMCQETIDWFEKKCFPYALESENPARESIKWLKSLKQRIGG